jgi:putative spermidine/putrescine transport system substrate-binding protein
MAGLLETPRVQLISPSVPARHSRRRRSFLVALSCGLMASIAPWCASVAADDAITFAGYGGTYQRDIVKALMQPAADREHARLGLASHNGLSTVRVQVKSGSPAWDIVQLGAEECEAGAREGLFERLDYAVIDTRGLPKAAYGAFWIAPNDYTVFMAWRRDHFGANPPRNWADFWNVDKFPGARALGLQASEMTEIALLADGVDARRLYPLDVPRALKSLARIAPHIDVWWSSGAQSSHLLRNGDVDLIAIWGSRLAPLLEHGDDIGYTFDQALVNFTCLAILKGSRRTALAQKVIAHAVTPQLQANIFKYLPYYGPSNELAVHEGVALNEFAAANARPENRSKKVVMDPRFWGLNMLTLTPRYLGVVAR